MANIRKPTNLLVLKKSTRFIIYIFLILTVIITTVSCRRTIKGESATEAIFEVDTTLLQQPFFSNGDIIVGIPVVWISSDS
ncbi:MAG: hypothetical protein Q7J34_06300 [Bacteroidales bacterium]|nr:hypothetical protein [Bacteroidales bacterium]